MYTNVAFHRASRVTRTGVRAPGIWHDRPATTEGPAVDPEAIRVLIRGKLRDGRLPRTANRVQLDLPATEINAVEILTAKRSRAPGFPRAPFPGPHSRTTENALQIQPRWRHHRAPTSGARLMAMVVRRIVRADLACGVPGPAVSLALLFCGHHRRRCVRCATRHADHEQHPRDHARQTVHRPLRYVESSTHEASSIRRRLTKPSQAPPRDCLNKSLAR